MAEDRSSFALSLLSAKRISVTPPGAAEPAVGGQSLALAQGEWVGLAGPNGSGKTSLLLGLAGLWPASGELCFDGRAFVLGADPAARRRLAVIQQDPSSQLLQPTVRDELAFGPRNLGTSEEEIGRRLGEVAERLGLAAELDRDPLRLSAGRQQMVLLGAALAASPAVLLADEATAHMDAESRRLALAILSEERARGLAMLWATQNSGELAAMDRVLDLGADGAPAPSLEPALALDPGESRLRVRVSPLESGSPGEGRLVRTSRPLLIEIGRRGMTGIVGPNGSGKSVILSAIAGLPSSAQISVEWLEAPEPPPIAALQFPELQIFQEIVADEIAYASVSRGRSRLETMALASKWLERLEFEPETFLRQRTWALAMGAKRLTEVIAALVAPSSVVVLDEPSAGLDPSRRARLGKLLRELALEGPIVLASQDLDWLSALRVPMVEITPELGQMPRPT